MDTSNFPSDSIQFIRELCLTNHLPKARQPAGIEGRRSTDPSGYFQERSGVALSGRLLFGTTAALTVLSGGRRLNRTAA
jgi:hypothetical protein